VVRHGVVEPVVLDELHAHGAVERLGYAQRVVEHTRGVGQAVHAVLLHLKADAVGEAGADEQDAAVGGQLPGAFGDHYFSKELHFPVNN